MGARAVLPAPEALNQARGERAPIVNADRDAPRCRSRPDGGDELLAIPEAVEGLDHTPVAVLRARRLKDELKRRARARQQPPRLVSHEALDALEVDRHAPAEEDRKEGHVRRRDVETAWV